MVFMEKGGDGCRVTKILKDRQEEGGRYKEERIRSEVKVLLTYRQKG